MSGHEFFDLLNHQERGCSLGVSTGACHEFGITFCLGFEDGLLTRCFCVVRCEGGVCLTLGDAALAFCFGFCSDFDLLLRNFLTSDLLCTQALTFKLVLSLLDLNLSLALGDFGTLECFCLSLSEVSVEAGDVCTGQVLTLNGLGFLLLHEDTAVCFSFFLTLVRFSLVASDLNLSLTVGLCLADGTLAGGVGAVHVSLGDGFGCGLGTDRLDVVGFVGDVRDVDVDEVEADLVKFGVDVVDDLAQERFTVAVDFLDGEGRNGQTELTKNDLFGHVLDLGDGQPEQTFGCVLHDGRLRVDTDGKGRRHVDANVLHRERMFEVDVDRHGLEVQEPVVLDQRPHDFAAAVITLCGACTFGVPVHDQDLV